jgi:hypothetical protein
MEWTTFHGHMLVLGTGRYIDWRTIGHADIHPAIASVHDAGGLVGVAHPFRIGSPLCSGCFWQFDAGDWHDIDYLEVWSETFPSIKATNLRAFELWTELLSQGRRVTATSGRDWHGGSSGEDPIALTWLGMDGGLSGDVEEAAKQAIRSGRVICTLGPLLFLTARGTTVTVHLDFEARKGLWTIDPGPLVLRLLGDQGAFHEAAQPCSCGIVSIEVPTNGLRWVRAELHGSVSGTNCMIAFTNPVILE